MTVAKTEKKPQSTLLVELADATLFHTPGGHAYATTTVDDHKETWPIRSKEFKLLLRNRFFDTFNNVPGGQAIEDALSLLEGRAIFRGAEYDAYLRVATHDGTIYLDLANDKWQVVKVDRKGWQVVTDPPVKFRRTRGMLPLPVPVDGSIADLREFVNIDDYDWILLAAWLVAAIKPTGPYPILAIHGEQGSAKSVISRMIRSVIDPNTALLRSEPREERDLAITAANSWIVAFDNLSTMPAWFSDALCGLATGRGFATRELHTDDQEMLFNASRPIILNGIEELAGRSDLIERTIRLQLPAIPPDKRRRESEVIAAFNAAQPAILGGLLRAVSYALQWQAHVSLDSMPRMADFAHWVVSAEPMLGGRKDWSFMQAYTELADEGHNLAIESSPFAEALVDWFSTYKSLGGWKGSATELLSDVNLFMVARGEERDQKWDGSRIKAWPQTTQHTSGLVRRFTPNLRANGINVLFERDGFKRVIRFDPLSL